MIHWHVYQDLFLGIRISATNSGTRCRGPSLRFNIAISLLLTTVNLTRPSSQISISDIHIRYPYLISISDIPIRYHISLIYPAFARSALLSLQPPSTTGCPLDIRICQGADPDFFHIWYSKKEIVFFFFFTHRCPRIDGIDGVASDHCSLYILITRRPTIQHAHIQLI